VRRPLHAFAASIRSRDEPIKTVITALIGLLVASSFAIAGVWLTIGLAGDGFFRDQSTNSVVVLLITFLWTAGSVVLGGYIVARLHYTRGTLSAFMVLELFFGAGMVAEFWTPAASWYDTVALLFVIPCAILGATLARPRGLNWTAPVG
jgi:predicted permease